MSDTLIRRLAGMFGTSPFTTAQARRDLAAGRDELMAARVLGNELRAAVGCRVSEGTRAFELRHAGTVHDRRRRWQFEPVAPEPVAPSAAPAADPDEDLL